MAKRVVLFTEDSVEQRDTVPDMSVTPRAVQISTASDAKTLWVGGIPEAAATEVRRCRFAVSCRRHIVVGRMCFVCKL